MGIDQRLNHRFGKDPANTQEILVAAMESAGSGSVISNESANQRFPVMGFGDVSTTGKVSDNRFSKLRKTKSYKSEGGLPASLSELDAQ